MITFDKFSGASLAFLIVNIFVVALLGVMILAAYRRRIRALMRGGDAIAVNPPPERPGGLQLRFNIITTPQTEHASTQRSSIPFGVLGIEFLGALCFAVLAAVFWLSLSGTAILPVRFAAVTLCFMLPFSMIITLVIGPDRRSQSMPLIAFLALGVLLAIVIAVRQPEDSLKLLSDLLIRFFLLLGGGAFILSLGLFSRSLRAIWPTLLIIILLCTAGMTAQAALNNVFGDRALHLYLTLAASIGFWCVLVYCTGFPVRLPFGACAFLVAHCADRHMAPVRKSW